MRILFTNTGPWGTGSFTTAEGIALRLIERGHEVKIFFPDGEHVCEDTQKYYDNQQDLYEIWKFPIKNAETSIDNFPLMLPDPHPRSPNVILYKELTKAQRELYFTDCARHLRKLIDEFKPDVIESNHLWTMGHVLHNLGEKYFAVAHNSDQIAFEFDETMREIARSTAQHAQYVVAVTSMVRDQLSQMYDIPLEKVRVLENGYDPEIFNVQQVDRKQLFKQLELNIPDNADVVSFTGKLSKIKGFDTLLEANYFLQKYNPNLHIIVMGSGSLQDMLAETQDPHSLTNVHIIGHQPQHILAKVHNVSKVMVMPSRTEGFGNAAIEAMACGTPLITSDTGGPALYAVGGVVPAEAPQQLANEVVRILNLPAVEYQQLCEQALQVVKKYTWDNVVTQREEFYSELLKK